MPSNIKTQSMAFWIFAFFFKCPLKFACILLLTSSTIHFLNYQTKRFNWQNQAT